MFVDFNTINNICKYSINFDWLTQFFRLNKTKIDSTKLKFEIIEDTAID